MKEKISIVIPVYNVESYLDKCVKSVLEQTYTDFELFLIDDGSIDRSGKICEKYAQEDKRVRVIHQKNQGVSVARNVGIDLAEGRYITFLDSDDFVSKYYLELLYQTAKKYDSDLVICGFQRLKPGVELVEKLRNLNAEPLEKAAALEFMLEGKKLDVHAWGKLYEISLFQNIRYPEGKIHEDIAVTYKLIDRCRQVVYLPENLYGYVMRTDSIIHQKLFHPRMMAATEFYVEMLTFVEEKYPSLYSAVLYRLFRSNRNTLRAARRTKGYWKEKEILLSNIAMCRTVVWSRKEENIKARILVVGACFLATLIRIYNGVKKEEQI